MEAITQPDRQARRRPTAWTALVLAALGAALSEGCSHASGSAGTPNETPFPVQDQMFFLNGAGSNTWELKLTSYAGACAIEHQGDSKKANSSYLNVKLESSTDDAPPPGTYQLGANGPITLTLVLSSEDASCKQTDDTASSATLVLETASATGATGTLKGSIGAIAVDTTFAAAGCTRDDTLAYMCLP